MRTSKKICADSKMYIVECLTFLVLGRIFLHQIGREQGVCRDQVVYYIDSTWLAELFTKKIFSRYSKVYFERLVFSSGQLFADNGTVLRLWIIYHEMQVFLNYIDDWFLSQGYFEKKCEVNHKMFFLRQLLPGFPVSLGGGLWRSLYLVNICLLKRNSISYDGKIFLILKNHPFIESLRKYITDTSKPIVLVPVSSSMGYLKLIRLSIRRCFLPLFIRYIRIFRHVTEGEIPCRCVGDVEQKKRLAINNMAHFNLDECALNSDFSFWQQSDFSSDMLLPLLSSVDKAEFQRNVLQLSKHQMGVVALNRSTLFSDEVNAYYPALCKAMGSFFSLIFKRGSVDNKWLEFETKRFHLEKDYWKGLFRKHSIVTYLTWYKYSEEHCIIADAMRDVGGVLALYQRSFEASGSPETRMCADIMFGFSEYSAAIEKDSGSQIAHFIITGYLGDHRFSLVQNAANEVRKTLKTMGCEYIIAFFDENSLSDSRWWNGHEIPQHQYSYLLGELMKDPKMGLVLKPKNPKTLKDRLGPVAALLDAAMQTGRCILYGKGKAQADVSPCQAALSADVVIHSSLAAATAGVEAILAGVPTLFVDDENFFMSPFYSLGGHNVFGSWDDLWSALRLYLNGDLQDGDFGRFPEMMDMFDPFRDGRAAERMGTYLKWVVEGYDAGFAKEQVLADANQQYCDMWGEDKIVSRINCDIFAKSYHSESGREE